MRNGLITLTIVSSFYLFISKNSMEKKILSIVSILIKKKVYIWLVWIGKHIIIYTNI